MKPLLVQLSAILFLASNVFAGGEGDTKMKKESLNSVKNNNKKVSQSFDHSHAAWTKLLKKHVKMGKENRSSVVDYKNFDKTGLNRYLKTVSSVSKSSFNKWTKNQQLAFYINTYNAYTVKLILNNYPIASIKKIGSFFSNPWKKEFFKLFGKEFYLDKIEHVMVRESGKYKDARIHFAFNCASVGCPALSDVAWQATLIEKQFDESAVNFLSDSSRNRVNISSKTVEVSNIFKWYGKDFAGNKMGYSSLKDFFAIYADSMGKNPSEVAFLKKKNYSIKYSGYDWSLNQ